MAKPRPPRSSKPAQGLPDRETLLAFIRDAGETDKAAIARAFGLRGADRRALRDMLRELEAAGALGKRGRRGLSPAGALPPVGVADVVERDADGDLFVKLTKGDDAPLVRLAPDRSEKVAGALEEEVALAASEDGDPRALARDGLVNLGYAPLEAEQLLDGIDGGDAEEMLATALRKAAGGRKAA